MKLDTKDLKAECRKRLEMIGKKGNNSDKSCCFVAESVLNFREVPTLEESREAMTIIAEKMKEIGAEPYLIIMSDSQFGHLMNIFYVATGEDEEETAEEWKTDRQDIREVMTYKNLKFHNMFGYAYNMTDPDLSDFGYMGLSEDYSRRVM